MTQPKKGYITLQYVQDISNQKSYPIFGTERQTNSSNREHSELYNPELQNRTRTTRDIKV